jgi:hypothetical protein
VGGWMGGCCVCGGGMLRPVVNTWVWLACSRLSTEADWPRCKICKLVTDLCLWYGYPP